MTHTTERMRWGVERRLEFIEFRVYWEGGINRSDVTDKFGVSVPQASTDLSVYQKLAPENLTYSSSEKRYVGTEQFKPLFLNPSADRYLSEFKNATDAGARSTGSWKNDMPSVDAMPIPTRRIKPAVLKDLLAAMRKKRSVEICYQSMNPAHPDKLWRRISPHAFGFDGLRWHVRAFCHRSRIFKDFILSRCEGVRNEDVAGSLPEDDHRWNELIDVVLHPNPKLSTGQKNAIAEDFAMVNGELRIPVRRALLYYFEKRLRLDVPFNSASPADTPLCLVNQEEFYRALRD